MNEQDLRVIKTRENIEKTFLELLDQKGFSRVTVGELISACRISKGTFYYHYRDKYDLAEKILKRQFAVYDEILSNRQKAIAEGGGGVEAMAASLLEAAHVFQRLRSIQSPEFDAEKEITELLVAKFLGFLEQWEGLGIQYPYQVARYLAAVVIAEAEMVTDGRAVAGPEFFETLQELVTVIGRFEEHRGSSPSTK